MPDAKIPEAPGELVIYYRTQDSRLVGVNVVVTPESTEDYTEAEADAVQDAIWQGGQSISRLLNPKAPEAKVL